MLDTGYSMLVDRADRKIAAWDKLVARRPLLVAGWRRGIWSLVVESGKGGVA